MYPGGCALKRGASASENARAGVPKIGWIVSTPRDVSQSLPAHVKRRRIAAPAALFEIGTFEPDPDVSSQSCDSFSAWRVRSFASRMSLFRRSSSASVVFGILHSRFHCSCIRSQYVHVDRWSKLSASRACASIPNQGSESTRLELSGRRPNRLESQ
ncbi:hypothetical protein D7S86_23045 [Pararobbsia silviterrae]|uniref:Uncharacterized protein n=1 Tax=Pararobbsia silviterrae TaxID=1792498 RepID=A0A494X8I5_9BURK|nr:hypothetical protein D7S86_23045 [Pararobbsia silviterrae]